MDLESLFKNLGILVRSTDSEMINFEKHQREFLHELQRKRILLDECRQELNETVSEKFELERKLEMERRKNEANVLQMNLAVDTSKMVEDERQQTRQTLAKNAVQLEIAVSERDSLLEQMRAMQIENIKLKRQVEDLDGKHKCHMVFQKDILDQQNRLKTTLSQLTSSLQKLNKENEIIEVLKQKLNKVSEFELMVKYQETHKCKILKERDNLENELIMKSAELEKLKELLVKSPLPINAENQFVTEYWQNKAKELNKELTNEKETTWQLTEALKVSNDTKCKMEEREKEYLAKIQDLSKENILKTDVYSQTDEACNEQLNKDVE